MKYNIYIFLNTLNYCSFEHKT
uniref:Uncharacterized protein n=1 Tax=Rhizophora mucronata TaxID=61149 RepID=A0A2P2Q9Q9_RHIMU